MKKEKTKKLRFDFDYPPQRGYLHPYIKGSDERVLELISHRERVGVAEASKTLVLWQDWNTRELFTSFLKGSEIIYATQEMADWLRYRTDEYPSGERKDSKHHVIEAEGYAACENLLRQYARGQFMNMKCDALTIGKDGKGIVVGKLMLKKGGKHAAKV